MSGNYRSGRRCLPTCQHGQTNRQQWLLHYLPDNVHPHICMGRVEACQEVQDEGNCVRIVALIDALRKRGSHEQNQTVYFSFCDGMLSTMLHAVARDLAQDLGTFWAMSTSFLAMSACSGFAALSWKWRLQRLGLKASLRPSLITATLCSRPCTAHTHLIMPALMAIACHLQLHQVTHAKSVNGLKSACKYTSMQKPL